MSPEDLKARARRVPLDIPGHRCGDGARSARMTGEIVVGMTTAMSGERNTRMDGRQGHETAQYSMRRATPRMRRR